MEEEKIYCKNCGEEMKEDEKYCIKCGAKNEFKDDRTRNLEWIFIALAGFILSILTILFLEKSFSILFFIGTIISLVTGLIKYGKNIMPRVIFILLIVLTFIGINIKIMIIAVEVVNHSCDSCNSCIESCIRIRLMNATLV